MMLSGEKSLTCQRWQYPQAEVLQTVLGLLLGTAAVALSRGLTNWCPGLSGLIIPSVLNFSNNTAILVAQVFLQLLQSSYSNHG